MAFPMETERGPGDACHIWQVFLGEVHSGVSGTQVVVKELKVSASVQEQMQFLEEAQPYRWVVWRGRGGAGQGSSTVGETEGYGTPSPALQLKHPWTLPGPCSTATCSSAWPSVLK
jgi:hypothetical protein